MTSSASKARTRQTTHHEARPMIATAGRRSISRRGASTSIAMCSSVSTCWSTRASRYSRATAVARFLHFRIERQRRANHVERESRRDGLEQLLAAFAGLRRQEQRLGRGELQPTQFVGTQQIAFVVDVDARNLRGIDLAEHALDGGHTPIAIEAGGVDHVQHEVGLCDFFERRAKCGDQRVRQGDR